LDRETRVRLRARDEPRPTAGELAEQVRGVWVRVNSVVRVAEVGGGLAGYVGATGGEARRNRHTAYVVIGVLQACAGRGIGRALLAELERWARAAGVQRLELPGTTHTTKAASL